MGCSKCSSGLGMNCGGTLDIDDIGASCDCECHNCTECGSPHCKKMNGINDCYWEDEGL